MASYNSTAAKLVKDGCGDKTQNFKIWGGGEAKGSKKISSKCCDIL
jgi:hypothetical protein